MKSRGRYLRLRIRMQVLLPGRQTPQGRGDRTQIRLPCLLTDFRDRLRKRRIARKHPVRQRQRGRQHLRSLTRRRSTQIRIPMSLLIPETSWIQIPGRRRRIAQIPLTQQKLRTLMILKKTAMRTGGIRIPLIRGALSCLPTIFRRRIRRDKSPLSPVFSRRQ